jgi:hypothetical protein
MSGSFQSLARQIALIFATATVIWCLVANAGLLETLFRATVVYLAVSIVGILAATQLAHLTVNAESEESGEVDETAADQPAPLAEGRQ